MAARGPIIILLALSFAAAALPGQVRGVGAGRPDLLVPPHPSWQHDPQKSITIAWATRARENGSDVRYGRTPALELPRKRADTTSLIRGYRGFRHVAEFRELSPNTTYYYSVGSANLGWSDAYSFTTAPADESTFSFLALADMGTTPEAVAAVQAMASQNYACSIHAGDISYAGGNQAKWDQFFQEISPMASRHPYMTVVGNHENETREKAGVLCSPLLHATPGKSPRSLPVGLLLLLQLLHGGFRRPEDRRQGWGISPRPRLGPHPDGVAPA